MSTSAHPPITESQILTSYLLPPSALPTFLPYSSFLSLIPATYRNDPDYRPAIRNLYRNLQFQRDITLSQVQENIERECGAPAATLRANLARRIAIEEGETNDEDGEEKPRRKRRRVEHDDDDNDDDDDGDDDNEDAERGVKDEDSSSSKDEFTDPLRLRVQRAFYEDPSTLHPAAHGLALPMDVVGERIKSQSRSRFHTKQSLLASMEHASRSLESEVIELEAECEKIKGAIKETVGALSDLRYGNVSKNRVGDGGSEYREILDALAEFRNVLKADPGD